MPSFTLVDITTILGTTPFLGTNSYAKLDDLVKIAAWYTFCRCTGVTTPTPPAAPTYPSGAPTTQPGQIIPQNQTPCWSVTEGITNYGFGTVPLKSMPNPSNNQCSPGPGSSVYAKCMQITGLQFTVDVAADGTTNGNVGIRVDAFGGTTPGTTNYGPWAPGTTGNKTPIIVPGTGWTSFSISATNDAAGNNTATVTSQLWCPGTSPTTPQADCCPPDPTLSARLEQILAAVEAIYQAIPLQLTSLSESTSHSGLSGSGHISSLGAGTIGVKVRSEEHTSELQSQFHLVCRL